MDSLTPAKSTKSPSCVLPSQTSDAGSPTQLHRHTARYPTSSAGQCMHGALSKIAQRNITDPKDHSELAFLRHADLNMTDWHFDQLMDQGRRAAWKSGRMFAGRYSTMNSTVFSRSAGGSRVVESGSYWLQGYRGEWFKILPANRLPAVDLIIPEDETANNTLSVKKCLAHEMADPPPGENEVVDLLLLLRPTLYRLNEILEPQPLLEIEDLVCLADMCPYDSQASPEWKGWSEWCAVFEDKEWELLGYIKDLRRYYAVGQGSVSEHVVI